MEHLISDPKPSLSGPQIQVMENIEFLIKELDAYSKPANRFNTQPTYKTLFRYNFASFYERFGAEKTKLFRLTQTHYQERLPELCVVHTIPELEAHEDGALFIKGTIFISHKYFKNWLIAEDKDLYEREILELILSSLDLDIKRLSN